MEKVTELTTTFFLGLTTYVQSYVRPVNINIKLLICLYMRKFISLITLSRTVFSSSDRFLKCVLILYLKCTGIYIEDFFRSFTVTVSFHFPSGTEFTNIVIVRITMQFLRTMVFSNLKKTVTIRNISKNKIIFTNIFI